MEGPVALNPDEQRFIEAVGLHFESFGVARIGGRIVALLLLAPRPLTLEEIAELLQVSRASISTNTRQFIQFGILEPHSYPGDRRKFYVFAPHAWEHRLHLVRAGGAEIRRLMTLGQSAVNPENLQAKQRLAHAAGFGEFLEAQATTLMLRWREAQAAPKESPE